MKEPAKNPVDLGQVAYEAYCEHVGWQSVHGEPLPGFSGQAPRIQNAWRLAAEAAADAGVRNSGAPRVSLHGPPPGRPCSAGSTSVIADDALGAGAWFVNGAKLWRKSAAEVPEVAPAGQPLL